MEKKAKNYKKSKWGTPQVWGILKVKYKPTGRIEEFILGIKRMKYNNELIFCEAWGYDKGHPTDENHPDNWEVISVEPIKEKAIGLFSKKEGEKNNV